MGYHIKNRELLIKHESILRFESSLAKIFTAYRHALLQAKNKRDKERAVAYCQWKLNLRITGCVFEGKRLGWVSYFSQITSTAQLRAVNHTINNLIRRFGLSSEIKPKSLIKLSMNSAGVERRLLNTYLTLTIYIYLRNEKLFLCG